MQAAVGVLDGAFLPRRRGRAEVALCTQALLEAWIARELGPTVEGDRLPARRWKRLKIAGQASHDVGRVPARIAADEQIAASPLNERCDVVLAEHLSERDQVAFPMTERGALQ